VSLETAPLTFVALSPCRAPLRVEGPPLPLSAAQALPLMMTLVEWFTNSAKYGAHSVPGGAVEVTFTPHATNTTALFAAFFAGSQGRMHDFTDIRLIFVPTGGLSAQWLTVIPSVGPYYAYVGPDDDRTLGFIGNFLPWDVTIPGALINGQFSGPYVLGIVARSAPPAAVAGSQMWGASRGDRGSELLRLNPDTGVEITAIPAPATVNGAATGMAINPSGTVLYYQNGPPRT